MGVYLGTINPKRPTDISLWSLVVATPDLEIIPEELKLIIGGLEYRVRVLVKKWVHTLLYSAADLPRQPPKYSLPFLSDSSSSLSEGSSRDDLEEAFPMSKKSLLEIVRGRDPNSLLPEIRNFILGRTSSGAHQTVTGVPSQPMMN
jgi:hypothetical protein